MVENGGLKASQVLAAPFHRCQEFGEGGPGVGVDFVRQRHPPTIAGGGVEVGFAAGCDIQRGVEASSRAAGVFHHNSKPGAVRHGHCLASLLVAVQKGLCGGKVGTVAQIVTPLAHESRFGRKIIECRA